jgi:glycosyltransferase involved in cell wall biosynthesis
MKYSGQTDKRRGIVAISNLFPNEYEPRRGLFNLRQFKALSRLVPVTAVAPVSYFPMGHLLSRHASSGRVRELPRRGRVEGLEAAYPRYFYPPKIGRPVQGHLYYLGVKRAVAAAVRDVSAFALYGTWAYPDGFAVVKLAGELGLPCVIKVHGSDINDYMDVAWRRRVIVSTLNRADKVVAVSEALKRRMIECGVNETKIIVVYNGVDGEVFKTGDKDAARARLGIEGPGKRILFVGNLKPVKGVDDLIEAMRQLVVERSDARLHIVGYGPLEQALRQRVNAVSLQDNVHFEGEKGPEDVALWMNASDLLCLPSLNEGVPNVVLEALSCGLPVVATAVGGIPEVVSSEVAGILVEPRNPVMLYATISHALEHEWKSAAVSRFAERFSWESNAEAVYSSLKGEDW